MNYDYSPSLLIRLCSDPAKPRGCKIIPILSQLDYEGGLSNFAEVFGAPSLDGLGDCHEVTVALMADLSVARCSDGWQWVQGTHHLGGRKFFHSWMEVDGWAVDVANGKFLIMEAVMYRAVNKARGIVRRTAQQTAAYLMQLAPR